jgi:hypothetical protein
VPLGFLRRGSREEPDPAPPAASEVARGRRGVPLAALTEEWRLVGRIDIEHRLSDVLNRREEFPIADVSWAPIDGSGDLEPAPGLERADPFDLIVVFAGEGSLPDFTAAERAAHRLHKVSYDVLLDAPPFRILGTVYLFPGSEPERLMDRATDLFVAVTGAVTLLGDRPVGMPDGEVALVNRSYLRGVQQVDRRTLDASRALAGLPASD